MDEELNALGTMLSQTIELNKRIQTDFLDLKDMHRVVEAYVSYCNEGHTPEECVRKEREIIEDACLCGIFNFLENIDKYRFGNDYAPLLAEMNLRMAKLKSMIFIMNECQRGFYKLAKEKINAYKRNYPQEDVTSHEEKLRELEKRLE